MEFDGPRLLADNKRVEGIPLCKFLMRFDFLHIIDKNVGSVRNLIMLDLTLPVVEDGDTRAPIHNNDGALFIDNGFEIIAELDDSIIFCFQLGSFGAAHSDPTHMEGPHG
jgi:hypothetical protein